MQPTVAALCAVCIAAPVALHAGESAVKANLPQLSISDAAVKLASLPLDPTLLEVLGLQVQTINNIINANTTGAQAIPTAAQGFPLTAAQYYSLYQVLNAYNKVGITAATQFVNGQFNLIVPTAQANLALANTALDGYPGSVLASLGYDFAVIQNFIGNLGGASIFSALAAPSTENADLKLAATDDVTVQALPSDPTLLEVLGLQIQTINNIINANTTGAQAIPTAAQGFPLTPAQYFSLFQVLNAYNNIVIKAATQLVNGQFNLIVPTAQANLALANTALEGFPGSVGASVGYDVAVIKNFFGNLGGVAAYAAPNTENAGLKSAAATDNVTVQSLPSDPTLLEVLGLQIQTVDNIVNANTTGAQAIPTAAQGFPLTPAQYVSLYQVLNAYNKVGITAATQLVNGQFNQIVPTAQTNLGLANDALDGFGPSVKASVGYDAAVVKNFVGGLGAPNVVKKLDSGKATVELASADPVVKKDSTTTKKPAAFVNKLQDAVDHAVGANKVTVGKSLKSTADGTKAGSVGLPGHPIKTAIAKVKSDKEKSTSSSSSE